MVKSSLDYPKDEPFNLPVEYKGREIILPSRLVRRGYSYTIIVEVDQQEIIFEPDEEQNFRAIQENQSGKSISLEMVRAIGEALEKHLR